MKEIVIISSRINEASETIRRSLRGLGIFQRTEASFENEPVYVTKQGEVLLKIISTVKNVLEIEHVSEHFSPELYIVASTHRSASNTKTLSAHATGNFGAEAKLGGSPFSVCKTSAHFITQAILAMQRNHPDGYEVTLEATHHGPSSMNAPLAFIEIGSTPVEWNDMQAGSAVAQAIISAIEEIPRKPVAICFGGPHYAPNFMKPQILKTYAVGHICAKYNVATLSLDLVRQAIAATNPNASVALLDWKGIPGEERTKLAGFLQELGLPYKRTDDV